MGIQIYTPKYWENLLNNDISDLQKRLGNIESLKTQVDNLLDSKGKDVVKTSSDIEVTLQSLGLLDASGNLKEDITFQVSKIDTDSDTYVDKIKLVLKDSTGTTTEKEMNTDIRSLYIETQKALKELTGNISFIKKAHNYKVKGEKSGKAYINKADRIIKTTFSKLSTLIDSLAQSQKDYSDSIKNLEAKGIVLSDGKSIDKVKNSVSNKIKSILSDTTKSHKDKLKEIRGILKDYKVLLKASKKYNSNLSKVNSLIEKVQNTLSSLDGLSKKLQAEYGKLKIEDLITDSSGSVSLNKEKATSANLKKLSQAVYNAVLHKNLETAKLPLQVASKILNVVENKLKSATYYDETGVNLQNLSDDVSKLGKALKSIENWQDYIDTTSNKIKEDSLKSKLFSETTSEIKEGDISLSDISLTTLNKAEDLIDVINKEYNDLTKDDKNYESLADEYNKFKELMPVVKELYSKVSKLVSSISNDYRNTENSNKLASKIYKSLDKQTDAIYNTLKNKITSNLSRLKNYLEQIKQLQQKTIDIVAQLDLGNEDNIAKIESQLEKLENKEKYMEDLSKQLFTSITELKDNADYLSKLYQQKADKEAISAKKYLNSALGDVYEFYGIALDKIIQKLDGNGNGIIEFDNLDDLIKAVESIIDQFSSHADFGSWDVDISGEISEGEINIEVSSS